MKLINTTDYPDYFLRRMVSWCCKEIGLPVRYVIEARFGVSRSQRGGRAYLWKRKIGVRVGKGKCEIYELPKYKPGPFADKVRGKVGIRCGSSGILVNSDEAEFKLAEMQAKKDETNLLWLVSTTAHELVHLWLYRQGSRTRRGGGGGGSEQQTCWHEKQVMKKFEARRSELLAAWGQRPVTRPTKPKQSIQEKRAVAAQKKLAQWQRKVKLAQTKVRKYKQKVRYYEKVLASKRAVSV